MQRALIKRYENLFDFLSFIWALFTIFYSNMVTKVISIIILTLMIYKVNLVKRIFNIESKTCRIMVTIAGVFLGAFLGFLEQFTIFSVYNLTSFSTSFNNSPLVLWIALILYGMLMFSPLIVMLSIFRVAKEIVKQSDFETLTGPVFDFLFKLQNKESIISEYKFYNKPKGEVFKDAEFAIGGSLFIMAFLVGVASLLSIKSSVMLTLLTGFSASWKLINKLRDGLFSNVVRSWVFDFSSYYTLGIYGLISSLFFIVALAPFIVLSVVLSFSLKTSIILIPIYAYILTYLGRLNKRLKVSCENKTNHENNKADSLPIERWPFDILLFSFIMITFNLIISHTYLFSKYLLFTNSYSAEIVENFFLQNESFLIFLSMLSAVLLFSLIIWKNVAFESAKKDRFRIPIVTASSLTVFGFINPFWMAFPILSVMVYYIVCLLSPHEIKEMNKIVSATVYRDEAFYSVLNKKCGMDKAQTYHALLLGNTILLLMILSVFGQMLCNTIGYNLVIALVIAVFVFIFMSLYVHPLVHYIITKEKLIINTGFWIWKIQVNDIINIHCTGKFSSLNIFKGFPIPLMLRDGLLVFKTGLIKHVIIFPQDIEKFKKELERVMFG